MGRSRRQQRAEEQRFLNALAEQRATGRNEGAAQEREALIRDISERLLNEEAGEVIGFVESAGAAAAIPLIEEAARSTWGARWKRELEPVLLRVAASAPFKTSAGTVQLGFDVQNPRLASFFDEYTSRLSKTLSDTSYEKARGVIREALDEGLSVPNTAARLRERLPELGRSRAELIAVTETHDLQEGASWAQARESGVVDGKTWLHSGNSNPDPAHLAQNGVTVGVDETFPDGSMYPRRPNCGCTILYEVKKELLGGAA